MDETTKYWKQCIQDYISCMAIPEEIELTEEQENEVVRRLLDDDEMWRAIDDSMNYHINKVRGGQ